MSSATTVELPHAVDGHVAVDGIAGGVAVVHVCVCWRTVAEFRLPARQ